MSQARQDQATSATSGAASAPCPTCPALLCPIRPHVVGRDPSLADASFETTRTEQGTALHLGNDDDALHIVVDGLVMTENALPDGRRHVTGFRVPGDILRLPPAGAPGSGIMTAVPPTTICAVRFNPVNGHNGMPANSLLRLASDRLAWAENQLLLVARFTSSERVASFLAEMAMRIGTRRDGRITVPLAMNRETIADYLGLNAETVSRRLSDLRREGVIDLPRPCRVVIRDMRRLCDRAPTFKLPQGTSEPHRCRPREPILPAGNRTDGEEASAR